MKFKSAVSHDLRRLGLVLCMSMALSASIRAAGPGTITYQGFLTDPQGEPLPDGVYEMRFSLWNGELAGNELWSEQRAGANRVQVAAGGFAVELGAIDPFPPHIFLENDRIWLEIQADVDADGLEPNEIYRPRVPITSAPYTFQADRARSIVENFVVEEGESISKGDVVQLLESGKVKVGSGRPFGEIKLFRDGATDRTTLAALDESRFIQAHSGGGGWSQLWDTSGGSLELIDQLSFDATSTDLLLVALSSSRFVVSWFDTVASVPRSVVGAISGDTISFGEKAPISPLGSTNLANSAVAALTESTFVLAAHGLVMIGIVAGQSVSFGPAFPFDTNVTLKTSLSGLSANSFIVAYQEGNSAERSRAKVATVTGSSVEFGPAFDFNDGRSNNLNLEKLSPNKYIFSFSDSDNSNIGTTRVMDVDGADLSFGEKVSFANSGTLENRIAVFDDSDMSTPTFFGIAYRDPGRSNVGAAITGSVSGTSIAFGPIDDFSPGRALSMAAVGLPNGSFVISFPDVDDSNKGKILLAAPFFSGVGLPLGIAARDAVGGQRVPVILEGISPHHVDLDVGKLQYALPNGELSEIPTPVRVGLAVGPNRLLLDVQRD